VATFEKLRVLLDREENLPVLEAAGHPDDRRDRRAFLEAAFAEPLSFIHIQTGRVLEFEPLSIAGDHIAGIFKRARPVALHDRSLSPYEAENYEGSFFLLSLSKDQIAWAQQNKRLGSNKALFDSFFTHVTTKTAIRDWKAYVEYLRDESEYWSVINKRRADIAKITFTFLPPNALSADSRIYNLVKIVHGEAHPDIQQHVYRARPGKMNPDTETMNASARIAMEGGGEADVRSENNRPIYNSRTAKKITRDVPDDELPNADNPAFVKRARDWLFGE
jgi:hypothetical protein